MSLLKNSFWTTSANVVYAISQWVVLVIINKVGTVQDVGVFTVVIAITTPIFILSQFGLRSRIVIDPLYDFKFELYFVTRILTSIIALFCVCAFYFKSEYIIPLIIFSFFKLTDSIFDIIYGEYQRANTMKKITISRVFRSVSNILSFAVVFYITHNLSMSLFFYMLSSLLVLITLENNNFKLYKFTQVKCFDVKKILLISAPLAFAAFFISLNSNVPRLILEKYESLEVVGAYASFIYMTTVASIILTSLCQAFSPRMAKYKKQQMRREFTNTALILFIICSLFSFIFVIISLLFQDLIFSIMYNEGFVKYSDAYVKLILASPLFFFCLPLGNILTANGNIRFQPYMFFIISLLVVVFSFFTISKTGLDGAINSYIFSSLITIIFISSYLISPLKD